MENILSFFQKDITSFILNPEFGGVMLFIKTVFIIISILMLVGIIISLIRTTWFKRWLLEDLVESFAARPYGVKKTFKQWTKIQQRLETGREDEYKLALIEADSLFEDVLKRMGYGGETMTDRLKQIDSTIIPNIEQIWEAHKVRDNIVHDPDYRLNIDLTKRALAIYEKAFVDLEEI